MKLLVCLAVLLAVAAAQDVSQAVNARMGRWTQQIQQADNALYASNPSFNSGLVIPSGALNPQPILGDESRFQAISQAPQWQQTQQMQQMQQLQQMEQAPQWQQAQQFQQVEQGQQAELVPQSYTVGAVSLDQAREMGRQAATNVQLPTTQAITANLQHLPATTKQPITAKQQTEQAITNQAIYQTYEQRVLQPLQQTVRQPVIQPVLQPVIQPVIQQAQPVVQPMVERVVRPFVIRQVSPQLSTQVQKGSPLQPIVQEPMITGQKSSNAQALLQQVQQH